MIKITKHQEIEDDVAGEIEFFIKGFPTLAWDDDNLEMTLTLPEAKELLTALTEKLR
ncbi:MAG: hypothetical protein WC648_01140 [Candidatus Paceibacterota bacterium]|jgi:hypothetical protein